MKRRVGARLIKELDSDRIAVTIRSPGMRPI